MDSVWVCMMMFSATNLHPKDGACRGYMKNGNCKYKGADVPCDAVEYAPVTRGEWSLKKPSQIDMQEGFKNILAIMGDVEVPECSECKSLHKNKTTYCPSCGSKMEG